MNPYSEAHVSKVLDIIAEELQKLNKRLEFLDDPAVVERLTHSIQTIVAFDPAAQVEKPGVPWEIFHLSQTGNAQWTTIRADYNADSDEVLRVWNATFVPKMVAPVPSWVFQGWTQPILAHRLQDNAQYRFWWFYPDLSRAPRNVQGQDSQVLFRAALTYPDTQYTREEIEQRLQHALDMMRHIDDHRD